VDLTKLRVIWGAILFSTVVELGIVLWGDFDRHVDLQLGITLGLSLAALSSAAMSFLLPARLYTTALARLSLAVVDSPVQEPGRDYRTAAGTQRAFRDDIRSTVLRVYQAPFIVGLALGESVALFGFVVAQGRFAPSSHGLPHFALAWIVLGLRFPRASQILGPAERMYSARVP
jgi:hypothetical protein